MSIMDLFPPFYVLESAKYDSLIAYCHYIDVQRTS